MPGEQQTKQTNQKRGENKMINNVTLVGRLTKDPELRYTPSGDAVANFTLAVNRTFKNAQGEQEADFIMCQVWRKPAENVANYLKKGSLAGVTGSIRTRNYDKDGQRVYVTEVHCESVQFLEPKGSGGNNQGNDQGLQAAADQVANHSRNNQNNNQGNYQGNQQQGNYQNNNQQRSQNNNQGNYQPNNQGQHQNNNQQNYGSNPFQQQSQWNDRPGGTIDISDDDLPF
jgi:single-strand DNA-binding protein